MSAGSDGAGGGARESVLCVDDERQILDGLAMHLRTRFRVEIATSAVDALAYVEQTPELGAIVSDMRMPNMDGGELLRRCRAAAPHVSRILLTGHADTKSAVIAVNEGRIFRFLTKPCPPPTLIATVDAAVRQTRLVTAERDILERTLKGCIEALTEILSLASPGLFGRATQLKELVVGIARNAGWDAPWQYEVAAMLSQIALISLPEDLLRNYQRGDAMSEEDQGSIARLPEVADRLLSHVPRLDNVRTIIASSNSSYVRANSAATADEAILVQRGAQLLRTANEYLLHSSRGMTSADALAALRAASRPFDPTILDALGQLIAERDADRRVIAVMIAGLVPGMVLAQDLATASGILIATRGYEISQAVVERLRNYRHGSVHEPIHVVVHSGSGPAETAS